MLRLDCLRAVYPDLETPLVVTIMGATAAELHSLGHRPNFFYLQHAMGLASSTGLGLALSLPAQKIVVFDGDGSLRAAGIPTVVSVRTVEGFSTALKRALKGTQLTTVVAKVEATGPTGYVTDLSLMENRFQFRRYIESLKRR